MPAHAPRKAHAAAAEVFGTTDPVSPQHDEFMDAPFGAPKSAEEDILFWGFLTADGQNPALP